MKQTDDLVLAHAVVAELRACGHFAKGASGYSENSIRVIE